MSVFFDMFVPSRRHVEDERNRLEWTRDEEGEGDPHRGPIDLDSGVISIKRPETSAVAEAPVTTRSPVTKQPAAEAPVTEPPITKPSVSETRHTEP